MNDDWQQAFIRTKQKQAFIKNHNFSYINNIANVY